MLVWCACHRLPKRILEKLSKRTQSTNGCAVYKPLIHRLEGPETLGEVALILNALIYYVQLEDGKRDEKPSLWKFEAWKRSLGHAAGTRLDGMMYYKLDWGFKEKL